MPSSLDYLEPLFFEQITGLSAVKGLTPPKGAKVALIQAESKTVRWRDDGTNPTASVGTEISAGSILEYNGNFQSIKFIESAASAIINVSYYK